MNRRRLALATTGAMFAIACLAGPARAQPTSFAAELGSPFPTRGNSYGIVAQDFNKDGLIDVAVVNDDPTSSASNNVNVYLRRPTGGFAEEVGSPFPVGNG